MADRANQELQNSLRRPKIIFTDAYLNDPIKFETDQRFDVESALKNADVDLPMVDRDAAEFNIIDLNNDTNQFYGIHMYRLEVNQSDYEKIIAKKRTISQLIGQE